MKNFIKCDGDESGSIIIYVFIGAVLLSTLYYALSRNSRTVGQTLDDDQARIKANEIIDYGNQVAAAVTKLKLRGCDEDEINFDNDVESGYTNANAPSDGRCDVFKPTGGALLWSRASDFGAAEVEITGGAAVADVGSASSELVLVVEDVGLEVCTRIDELLGVPLSSDAPIQLPSAFDYSIFTGTYGSEGTITVTGATGRLAACVEGIGANDDLFANAYHYYQVLLAR